MTAVVTLDPSKFRQALTDNSVKAIFEYLFAQLNALTIATPSTLTVTGNGTVGGDFDVTGDATVGGTLDITGATAVGGALAVTGASTLAAVAATSLATNGLLSDASLETGVTAGATQTQAGATVLSATKYAHTVATVGTAGDGVRIGIAATVGAKQFVANDDAADSMQLYGLGTDTINGVATGTGVAVDTKKAAWLYCVVAGNWHAVIA